MRVSAVLINGLDQLNCILLFWTLGPWGAENHRMAPKFMGLVAVSLGDSDNLKK